MSRDYQGDRKRSNGRTSHPLVTGVFIGVLVGLCLALAVALYLNKTPSPFVNRDKPAEPDKTAPQAGKTVPKYEPVKPEAEKAPAPSAAGSTSGKAAEPKTRLDFYTILPGKEEVVPDKDVSRAAPAGGTARVVYYLQAGAFQNAADADNLKARLALAGLEAQIQTATLPDKSVWHRVRMGPFSNAQDLDKARAALRENKIENAVIKVSEPLAKR
ncbi:MAG TPA: SPOR domain-containing protein [Burkholderiales bacterium]|nr:SPOR domain-containing protein [Burkholderiales bacterium]